MIEKLIKKYVDTINLEDIYHFAEQNGVHLTSEECAYLYHTIQTKWENVVFKDPDPILKDAKTHLRENTYKKAEELLYFYLDKYKHYL